MAHSRAQISRRILLDPARATLVNTFNAPWVHCCVDATGAAKKINQGELFFLFTPGFYISTCVIQLRTERISKLKS